jgi:hypothetical protein
LIPFWFLDCGATHPVTSDQSLFLSMTPTFGLKIRSANGHVHEVKGVGTITMKFPSGEIKNLPNVLFCLVSKRTYFQWDSWLIERIQLSL